MENFHIIKPSSSWNSNWNNLTEFKSYMWCHIFIQSSISSTGRGLKKIILQHTDTYVYGVYDDGSFGPFKDSFTPEFRVFNNMLQVKVDSSYVKHFSGFCHSY